MTATILYRDGLAYSCQNAETWNVKHERRPAIWSGKAHCQVVSALTTEQQHAKTSSIRTTFASATPSKSVISVYKRIAIEESLPNRLAQQELFRATI